MEDGNVYTTRDFYISAFLLAKGHRIAHVNRDDPKHVFFAFNDFESRTELLRAFLYGEGVVEPQAFIAAIKTLKQFLYSTE